MKWKCIKYINGAVAAANCTLCGQIEECCYKCHWHCWRRTSRCGYSADPTSRLAKQRAVCRWPGQRAKTLSHRVEVPHLFGWTTVHLTCAAASPLVQHPLLAGWLAGYILLLASMCVVMLKVSNSFKIAPHGIPAFEHFFTGGPRYQL